MEKYNLSAEKTVKFLYRGKINRFKEIKEFFETRVIRNKDKYEKNKILVEDYKFVKKVIDLFCDIAI